MFGILAEFYSHNEILLYSYLKLCVMYQLAKALKWIALNYILQRRVYSHSAWCFSLDDFNPADLYYSVIIN